MHLFKVLPFLLTAIVMPSIVSAEKVGRRCTLKACQNNLDINIKFTKSLPLKIAVDVNGERLLDECKAIRPHDITKLFEDAVKLGRVSNTQIRLITRKAPFKIDVAVYNLGLCEESTKDQIYIFRNIEPSYKESFPNGKNCGGSCRTAAISLSK